MVDSYTDADNWPRRVLRTPLIWGVLLLALLVFTAPSRAAEWYAAPNATRDGTGTKNNPWPLQTAVDRITPIGPGDVLWLRGGIYQSNYLFYLTGDTNRYITVRSFPNERVIFDGSPLYPNAFPLTIEGAWTIYRDFEVLHSTTWTNNSTPVAIQCLGSHVKLINLVVHDAGQGIGFWKESINSEIYGSLIYYNGVDSQEHGIYTQNETGTKRIRDSMIFHNSGYGIHAYAQSGYALGYEFTGNVLFQNGRENGELFVGSFHPADRLTVISNYSVAKPDLTAPAFRLTDRDHSNNPNGSAVVRDNIVVGGAGFTAQDFYDITFVNNVVVSLFQQTHARPPPGQPLSEYVWNQNRYHGISAFAVGTTNYDFAEWQALSGLDGQSTYSSDGPTGLQVFVRPNEYEPKRANVVIYNWDLADNVQADVSGLLEIGDRFELRNASDYLGTPVIHATYAGGVITVPMTNLAVALPGRASTPPPHTGPLFAAFVLSVPYVTPSDLITQWSMDEATGTQARDAINGHHGAFINQPTWTVGRSGGALSFDGNDTIRIADDPELDLTNDLSISLWFKPGQLINASSGRHDLLAKYISYWMLINYPFNDGRLTFAFNSGAPTVRSTRTSWAANEWYHVVGTFNGTEMKLYVNGLLEGETATTFRVLNTTFDLELGGNSVQQIYYNGALDEVRLYNYALTEPEILQLYQTAGPTNVAPVINPIPDQSLNEGGTLNVTAVALDPDSSSNPVSYSLDSAPAGASIHPVTGAITWTPAESQAPSTNFISVRVNDNDTPNLSTVQHFKVFVEEVNQAPVFATIAPQAIAEESTLVLFNLATDPDIPANSLTFSFEGSFPEGARVNSFGGGLFVWSPSEGQGPTTNQIRLRVADNAVPPLSSTQTFTVVVTEVPRSPQLQFIPDQTIMAGEPLIVLALASDPDLPANTLRYSLNATAPPDAVIDPLTGVLIWPPQLMGRTNLFSVQVSDDSNPPQTDSRTFLVTVLNRPAMRPSTLQGQILTLRWDATSGQTYRIQYKTHLHDPVWLDLPGDVVATGSAASKVDAINTAQQRFYRVSIVPSQ